MTGASAWFVRPSPRPAASLALACFAHAGGGPVAFHRWPAALPAAVDVLAARLPGRDARLREAPIADWPELLDALAAAVAEASDGPLALFGHSLGGMVAYELGVRLADAGRPPELVALAGCIPPDLPRRLPRLHDVPDGELVAALGTIAGTPPEVLADDRLLALLLPMVRADLRLAETWPPAPPRPLAAPLVVFAGADDDVAPPAVVAGWSRYGAGAFTAHVLPGDHFFPRTAEPALLDLLGDALLATARR